MPHYIDNTNFLSMAKYGVTLWAAGQLPIADGIGGPGTIGLPACLALCIAGLSASSGGLGAIAAWYACKTACIALAVAADEPMHEPMHYYNASL